MVRQLIRSGVYGFTALMVLLCLVAVGLMLGLSDGSLNILVIGASGLTIGTLITLMKDLRATETRLEWLIDALTAQDGDAESDADTQERVLHRTLAPRVFAPSRIGSALSKAAITDQLIGALRNIAAPYEGSITGSTELYYDLGLAGDDLYEAIEAVRAQFRTDFRKMDLRRYAPNEVGHNFGLNLARELNELSGARTYRSLTVESLVLAVQAGVWEDW